MINPFDIIIERINSLESRLPEAGKTALFESIDIISRFELCKRLNITEPTAIRWEKKGKIPCFRIGSSVRYNWVKVIQALEGK